MNHIYCISGFGADERVFSHLNFYSNNVTFIQWIEPLNKETIEQYAKSMSAFITHENPVLLGLSFGGIMCTEIAKIISVKKIIIISSVKTFREMPLWMRLSGKLNLYKLSPTTSYKIFEPLQNYNLGITNSEELKLVRQYRLNVSRNYIKWAIKVIVNWRNHLVAKNLIHIHGTKDRMFPLKNLHADYVINNGGHFMIMNRADDINEILRTELIS